MREYLFRGKCCGSWHYGNLIRDFATDYVGIEDENGVVNANAKTICQYIGICDKNNNKIFEHDILKCGNDLYFVVRYNDDTSSFILVDTHWINNTEQKVMDIWATFANKLEVVGNEFDNGDLLCSQKNS